MKKDRKLCLFAAREKPFRVRPTLQKYNTFFVFTILLKKKIKILQHCKALALPWGLVALVISFKQKKFSPITLLFIFFLYLHYRIKSKLDKKINNIDLEQS